MKTLPRDSRFPSPRIRYDPSRVDLAVTEVELIRLKEGGQSVWKDVFLLCLPLTISCVLNAIDDFMPFQWSWSFFLNLLFTLFGLGFGVVSLILWRRSHTDCELLVDAIRQKPLMELNPAGDFATLSLVRDTLSPPITGVVTSPAPPIIGSVISPAPPKLARKPPLYGLKGLFIRNATYGAAGHRENVTQILRSKMSGGKLKIQVSNAELGGDPVQGVPKELRVDYTYGGRELSIVIPETKTLSLP